MRLHRTGLFSPLALSLFALWGPACSSQKAADGAAVQKARQALDSAQLTLAVPVGVDPRQLLLSGEQQLIVHDRVQVGSAAAPVAVVGAGGLRSEIAANSTLHGSAWIAHDLFLGSDATINGDLHIGGSLERQDRVSVLGQIIIQSPVAMTSHTWNVVLPAPGTSQIVLEPGQATTAGPGAYATIDVRSGSTLHVSSGSYFVDSFSFQPNSHLDVDASRGPVAFYVTGQIRSFPGSLDGAQLAGNLLIAYLGTSRVEVDNAFRGTVIAPQATLSLRRPNQGLHRGSFFAKEVEIESHGAVELEPFAAIECLTGSGCSGHGRCVQGTGSVAFQCRCEGDWVGEQCELFRPILPATPAVSSINPSPTGQSYEAGGLSSDGGVLAATNSAVYRIDASGTSSLFADIPDGSLAEIDAQGQGFALQSPNSATLFDLNGFALANAVVGPFDYVKVFPGAQRLFIAHVVADSNSRVVASGQVVGSGFSQPLASSGVVVSAVSQERLHYTNGVESLVMSTSGTVLQTIALPLRRLAVDDSGDHMIAEPARRGSSLVHAKGGYVGDAEQVQEPLWDVAISPDGVFSAATWQTGVHVFAAGSRLGSYSLPLRFASRVAVSNRGEVLVGGKTANGNSLVLLLARSGAELWRLEGAAENHAYRPDVAFFPSGDTFMTRTTGAITIFNIDRSH